MYTISVTKHEVQLPAFFECHLDSPLEVKYSLREIQEGLLFSGWILADSDYEIVVSDDEDTVYPLNKKRDDVLSSYARKIDISAHSKKQQGFSFKLLPKTSSLTISAREVATGGELVPLFDLSIDGPFKVLVGKNKWLFLDNDTNKSVAQHIGDIRLTLEAEASWREYFQAFMNLQSKYKIPAALLIAPSKEAVVPEFHPLKRARNTVIEDVLALIPNDFPCVYPLDALRASKDRSFRVTDTHWTCHGAKIGAIALCERLGIDIVKLHSLFEDDEYKPRWVMGDLGVKVYPPVRNKEYYLSNYSYRKFLKFDNELPTFGRMLVMRNGDALKEARLLIFGSSSSYSMFDYLSRVFRQVVFVHSAGNVDPYLVEMLKPDYLLSQTNGRYVVRSPSVDYDIRAVIKSKYQDLTEAKQSELLSYATTLAAKTGYPVVEKCCEILLSATNQ